MNALMISSAAASMAVLVGLLIGRARHSVGRPAVEDRALPVLVPATVSAASAHCGRTGHHYRRLETGWCCAHCGDEVRTDAPSSVALSA